MRDAALITPGGQGLTINSLRGKVLVISDVMTLCQETCPLDTANVVTAAKAVDAAGWGNDVEFLSITIDPARDTGDRLAAYQGLYAPYPANWVTLTGSDAVLAGLWSRLGVYVQKVPEASPAPRDWLTGRPLTYDVTHSDDLFFIDTTGHERFVLTGAPHVGAGAPIPAPIRNFMDADGNENLAHPDPAAWSVPQALAVIGWLVGHAIPTAGAN